MGARSFWIHNTGPLGCLPRIIAKFGKDTTKLDQFGCVNSHNRAANQFNMQLHDLCTKFRAQLPEANITYVDIFSVKLNLISNYSQYGKELSLPHLEIHVFQFVFLHFGSFYELWLSGFKQPLAACCGYGGPPLNFDSRIACGQTKNLNGSLVTAIPCNNTAEYVNWDGNHYTEAANEYVSSQILTGNYSDPPLSVTAEYLLGSKL